MSIEDVYHIGSLITYAGPHGQPRDGVIKGFDYGDAGPDEPVEMVAIVPQQGLDKPDEVYRENIEYFAQPRYFGCAWAWAHGKDYGDCGFVHARSEEINGLPFCDAHADAVESHGEPVWLRPALVVPPRIIEVTVTRATALTGGIVGPGVKTVTIDGPGIHQVLGSWSFMCGEGGGRATEVSDEVVLRAFFGDQSIYSTDPAPDVAVEKSGENTYRVTVRN